MWSPSVIAKQRAAKRKPTYYVWMNMWPFVAVMTVLVFITIGNRSPHSGSHKQVDLAFAMRAAPEVGAAREDVMRITVTRTGDLFFNDRKVPGKELPGYIREGLQHGAEDKVYLAVDARSLYRDTEKVLSQLQIAGIENICFLLDQRNPTAIPEHVSISGVKVFVF